MTTETQAFLPPNKPTQYRAIGLLRATYLPSANDFAKGTLVAEDGKFFPAKLSFGVTRWLKNNPEQLDRSQLWKVWPRTSKKSPHLQFFISSAINIGESSRQKEINDRNEYFSIRGQLWSWNEQKGKLIVKISRNEKPPKETKNAFLWKPFFIKLKGYLPVKKKRGQFWEFDCVREGEALLMKDGQMIKDARKPKKKKPKEASSKEKPYKSDDSLSKVKADSEVVLEEELAPQKKNSKVILGSAPRKEPAIADRRVNKSQMSLMMGIAGSTLDKRIREAKKKSDPPIIEHDGQCWRYIPNPDGRGKIFELIDS